MKNLYLDVDGVILLDDLKTAGQGTLHLSLFLMYLSNLQADDIIKIYWLTTHCRDGSDEQVLWYLKQRLTAYNYDLIIRIKIQPTAWDKLKTEAIDFSKDFFWIDDDASLQEQEVLWTHKAEHKLIKIDLRKNKNQLQDIINSGILNDSSLKDNLLGNER